METNQHTAGTTEERAFHSVKGKNDNMLACSEFQATSEYLDGSYNSCICMDNLHCMYKVLHWFPYNTPISSSCSFSEDSFSRATRNFACVCNLLNAGLGEEWKGDLWITGKASSLQKAAFSTYSRSQWGSASWTDPLQGNNLNIFKIDFSLCI